MKKKKTTIPSIIKWVIALILVVMQVYPFFYPYRFIFAFSTSLLIQAITVEFVDKCGGDAAAWRTVAIIYAIIGLVENAKIKR